MCKELEALLFMNAGLWVIVLAQVIQLTRTHARLRRIERVLGLFTNQQPPDDGSI